MVKISRSFMVIMLTAIMHFYFYHSNYIKEMDYEIYDLTTLISKKFREEKGTAYSVVVDIDEKSIQEFGQWPWSRIIDMKLIKLIDKMSPSAIGINILFPEEDRLSPISMQKFYKKYFDTNISLNGLPSQLYNNDKYLSEVIQASNATLSVYLQNKFHSAKSCESISYKNNIFKNIKSKFLGEELLCNHPSVQEEVENFGFINAWSDNDGVFRRVPLFMRYKKEVFPSFSLATLLSFDGSLIPKMKEDTILVNFSFSRPKVISASDILKGEVPIEDIQGKVVILGSSVVGLSSRYAIANTEIISNSMIHAVVVDNILKNTFLTQVAYYKKINIVLSFLFSLLVFFLLSKKRYAQSLFFLFILAISSSLFLFFNYMHGIYISIGYLWISFMSFFIVLLIYHLKVMNQEHQEQEKFLIRQSKMASMGEMIALIAHQWRQPLSAINGIVLNMDVDYRKEKLDKQRFNQYLDEVESTTAYLSKTINDFTDFFSRDKTSHVFSLSKVITQAKHLSASSSAKNVSIIYRNHEDVKINGYASELVQSLLVLLNNAIYICQEKQETIGDGKIFIDIKKLTKSVIVTVEDNGGGIAKQDMKKIFNPYYTTKEKHHGTGLGLYILKLIVEDSMNGKVSVENAKEGAIFSLEIPLKVG